MVLLGLNYFTLLMKVMGHLIYNWFSGADLVKFFIKKRATFVVSFKIE